MDSNLCPSVSVIIPVYNRWPKVKTAIESVVAQKNIDHDLLEIIIISDGCREAHHRNLCDYLDRLGDPRISVIRACFNSGVSRARNLGAMSAKGKYLAFLDSDDQWLPHKVAAQLKILKKGHDRWVHGSEIWIRNGVRVNPKKYHQKAGGDLFLPSLQRCLISPSVVMLEKSLFCEYGGFREDFAVCEDYDLWLKILQYHPIAYIPDPMTTKTGGHADQLSRKANADYFRIQTLAELLSHGSLSAKRANDVEKTLIKKVHIYCQGLAKRGKSDLATELKKNLSTLSGCCLK